MTDTRNELTANSDRAKPEFSRPFNTERLQDATRDEIIVANAAELQALAARLDIPAVKKLSGSLSLGRMPDEPRVIEVRGTVTAEVVQSCVATLEPVTQQVVEEFDTLFASESYVQRWLRDNPHDELDGPEALDGSWLDLGELVTQYLILGLDPYPRCAEAERGVELPGVMAEEPVEEKQTPFAVLKALQGND